MTSPTTRAAQPYAWLSAIDAAWPRFIAKISATDPMACWLWLGATSCGKGNSALYGSFRVNAQFMVRAHIFACAAAGEAIPGQSRDHMVCGNTLCVNPWHLEGVTASENSLRRWRSTPTWRKPLTA
jgi:hypothetical protein